MNYHLIEKYLGEATKNLTVDEFIKETEVAIRKSFPKSYVNIRASTNLGSSITLRFALGKDKSEWTNGIIENDPLYHIMHIGWNSFADNNFTKDKIPLDMNVGGSLKVNPEEGSYMAFGKIKIGFRKKTASPDKIVKAIEDYFKKAKKVLMDNKNNLPKSDYELNKNKL